MTWEGATIQALMGNIEALNETIKKQDEIIKALKQKKGYWVPIPFALDYKSDAKCSLCKESFIDAINYNYCPNCGAKMESEEICE